ncbi:hypothetical protein M9Y10_001581 [Tritrichomonas musculus]|uniref:Uncharacterized protein n=1 Tax=Tritrichomonas musculus TaxID=1915356 RepID=A0ABR2LAF8_9EUKA
MFKDCYQKYLTNDEFFNIFRYDKHLLLTLLENIIFSFNKIIALRIKYNFTSNYARYFINEISPFLDSNYIQGIAAQSLTTNDFYEENRKIGENEKKKYAN